VVAVLVDGEVWSREFADDFREVYHGPPPKMLFAQVKAVAKRYGWALTRPALRAEMESTPLEYLNLPKTLAVRIEAGPNSGPAARAAPSSPGRRSAEAGMRYLENKAKRGG